MKTYVIKCKLNTVLTIITLSSMMLIAGCSDDSTPKHVKEYVKQVKSQPAKPIEGIPNIETSFQSKQYAAHNLRNPFKKPLAKEAVTDQPDLNRPKEPLEAFPLDALHMVGNISRSDTIWAIVAAPNGTVYPITEGQYMGQHLGQVVKITADKIEIIENIRVGDRWKKQQISLSLYE